MTRPKPQHRIYVEVVVMKPDNAVVLTKDEMLSVPCHFLKCHEVEKRLLAIDYTAGNVLATREKIIAVHLAAYKRKHGPILTHTVFDELPALP